MKRFADLLDRLLYTPSRNGKLTLMADYFRTVPDPDRGWGLAALAGGLNFPNAKAGAIRALAAGQTDETLFRLSYDYVGDLAETCALLWQGEDDGPTPSLSLVVDALRGARRADVQPLLSGWLDRLDGTGRWALLKLVTGGLRIGVSSRLAKVALADAFGQRVEDIEEIWHGVDAPYDALFGWLEGRAPKPDLSRLPAFRPFMLAHPLEEADVLDPADWQVEWKWDGIRAQIVSVGGQRRVYSRSGDDISGAFPDIVAAMDFEGALDGELLVRGPSGEPAPFGDLQQRLNRKTVSKKMLADRPAHVIAYDILFDGPDDLRALPLMARRTRLEDFLARAGDDRFTISPLLDGRDWNAVAGLQAEARRLGREGLMLKRRDGAYVAGRVKGQWIKWKRDPLSADTVLLYAQRGHGRRSSLFSDFTFGVWRGDDLVPVGKAYFGFTDAELRQLDKWIREHTTDRFGPVREVEKALVLEVAFDSIHPSSRHKSGLAMRFPRIARIRWDKPAAEADRLESLQRMIDPQG